MVDWQPNWPDSALTIRTSRSSGAGGQHVNRTDSRVEYVLDLTQIPDLPPRVREQLGDTVRVVSQSHRSQLQNRREALERLLALLAAAAVEPTQRVDTAVPKAQKRRRLADKVRRAAVKSQRGRVRGDE
ncbi:MAG: aminoacyl-tRNA hydrolase [Deltaproteobacteria bacterium]|nr:aminoacyl-tRNA hydrolase [Deltaproteobacteria bacterium]